MTPPKDYSRLGGYLLFVHVLLVIQVSLDALYIASGLPSVLRADGWPSPAPRWHGWLNLAVVAATLALGVAALVCLRRKKKTAFTACYAARLCMGIAGSALGLVVMYLYDESMLAFAQEETARQMGLYESLPDTGEFVQAFSRAVMGVSYAVIALPLLVNAGFLIAWLAYSRRSKRAAAYFDPAYRPPAVWFGYAPLGVAPYGPPVRPAAWPPPGAQHPCPPPGYPAPPGAQYSYPPPDVAPYGPPVGPAVWPPPGVQHPYPPPGYPAPPAPQGGGAGQSDPPNGRGAAPGKEPPPPASGGDGTAGG